MMGATPASPGGRSDRPTSGSSAMLPQFQKPEAHNFEVSFGSLRLMLSALAKGPVAVSRERQLHDPCVQRVAAALAVSVCVVGYWRQL
jgi:hypothetical protein